MQQEHRWILVGLNIVLNVKWTAFIYCFYPKHFRLPMQGTNQLFGRSHFDQCLRCVFYLKKHYWTHLVKSCCFWLISILWRQPFSLLFVAGLPVQRTPWGFVTDNRGRGYKRKWCRWKGSNRKLHYHTTASTGWKTHTHLDIIQFHDIRNTLTDPGDQIGNFLTTALTSWANVTSF